MKHDCLDLFSSETRIYTGLLPVKVGGSLNRGRDECASPTPPTTSTPGYESRLPALGADRSFSLGARICGPFPTDVN